MSVLFRSPSFDITPDDQAVVHVDGALDRDTSRQLTAVVERLLVNGTVHCVVNMTAVHSLDRAAVQTLFDLTLAVHRQGGSLRLATIDSAALLQLDTAAAAAGVRITECRDWLPGLFAAVR